MKFLFDLLGYMILAVIGLLFLAFIIPVFYKTGEYRFDTLLFYIVL